MPTISENAHLCTVVVTLEAEPELLAELLDHARVGIERFPAFPGFVAGALQASVDGGRLVQYLQWESEALYRACLDDPAWDELPSTRKFLGAVEAGEARMDARVYSVVVTSTGDGRERGDASRGPGRPTR